MKRTILSEISLNALLKVLLVFERRIILLIILVSALIYREKLFFVEGLSLRSYPVVLGNITKIPYCIKDYPPPQLTAQSVLVADLNTTRILYEKNSTWILAPASTTKLMTALVSLDLYNLQDTLKIPEKCLKIEGSKLDLSPEEILLVNDLLHALLITSSNEAACILANNAVPEEEFVRLMNNKAKDFKMSQTNFTNPIGFDSYDYSHKSTAKDLYILALQARANPIISKIYSKSQYTLTSGKYSRTIQSTNLLLSQLKGSVGMKTGTTTQAGEVFIYEYKDDDRDLLIILMGSETRFYETKAILNWINSSFAWI
jgi:D-alanyl-D-alanine carboxypeptidase (penicillin-binding protein 5/6)